MRVRQMSTTSWQAMSKIEHVSRPNQLISCPSGDNSLGIALTRSAFCGLGRPNQLISCPSGDNWLGVALTSSALCGLGKGDEKQQN